MPRIICPTVAVKNMEESVQFYTDILQLTVKGRIGGTQGLKIVFLEDEKQNLLELIEHPQEESDHGNVSILLGVANLQATMEELKARNIAITRGPIEAPSGQKFIFIQDPNGVNLELMEGFHL